MASVPLLGLIALLPFAAKSSRGNGQEDLFRRRHAEAVRALRTEDIRVENKTSAFSLLAMDKTPEGLLKLTLRNDYNKTITAYQLSVGITSSLVDKLTSPHKAGIEPGETVDELEGISLDPESAGLRVRVLCVLFDDGSDDGDAKFVLEVKDWRIGEMMQVRNFTRSLREASTSGVDVLTGLNNVKAAMLDPESEPYRSMPVLIKSGIRGMGQWLSGYVDDAIRSATDHSEQENAAILNDLQRVCDHQFAGLRNYTTTLKRLR